LRHRRKKDGKKKLAAGETTTGRSLHSWSTPNWLGHLGPRDLFDRAFPAGVSKPAECDPGLDFEVDVRRGPDQIKPTAACAKPKP